MMSPEHAQKINEIGRELYVLDSEIEAIFGNEVDNKIEDLREELGNIFDKRASLMEVDPDDVIELLEELTEEMRTILDDIIFEKGGFARLYRGDIANPNLLYPGKRDIKSILVRTAARLKFSGEGGAIVKIKPFKRIVLLPSENPNLFQIKTPAIDLKVPLEGISPYGMLVVDNGFSPPWELKSFENSSRDDEEDSDDEPEALGA